MTHRHDVQAAVRLKALDHRPQGVYMGHHRPIRAAFGACKGGANGAAPGQFERDPETVEFIAEHMYHTVGVAARARCAQ